MYFFSFYVQSNVPMKTVRDLFRTVVLKAGFNDKKVTHHCNRAVSS